ncbi:V-type ATPase 116kDa subunit family protein [Oscillospiraceae bacterium PP1C4]
MSIAKLSLVNIMGDMEHLDHVIIRCLDSGDFHPEKSLQFAGGIQGFVPLSEENPYTEMLSKITSLGIQAGLNPKYMPEHATDQKLAKALHKEQFYLKFCNTFSQELSALNEKRNYLKGEMDQDESALVYLSHLAELNVTFEDIFSCKYTKVRFGRLPVDSYAKLSFYEDKPFIFTRFNQEKDYQWGAYFALNDDIPAIDDIFASLFFERMRVPDFVHGTPEEMLHKLRDQISHNRAELALVEQQIHSLVSSREDSFQKIYTRMKFLSDSFEMRKYVSVLKSPLVDMFYITGFIEQDHAERFSKNFDEFEDVTVEIKPHDSDKRVQVPTKLKNGWFTKPFEMFVEMYGLPSYSDPDPTPFLAFTYCLLFGIMFGDLGQGLLLVLGGALLWKYKKMNIGRIINRIGIFSCIFGVLYGSVFGLEELLTPFYTDVLGLPGKPIEVMAPEMTNTILISAVGLGIVLICTSIIIDIVIGFMKRDYERAVFSANGIAGLTFYGSVLFGAVMRFTSGVNYFSKGYVLGLIILPLTIILLKEPLSKLAKGFSVKDAKPGGGFAAYLTESIFELFEVVLSFFSNTMSFLRVGGFVLSHAGMMAVVITLSEMVGGAGSPIVIIVGNLFVIGMEGLIVGIQVLRLEFYEMFSRYFDGDGKPFTPITVSVTED